MAAQKISKERRDAFLKELTDLTHKHGIAVAGCGCCDSPYLYVVGDSEQEKTAVYWAEKGNGQIGLRDAEYIEKWGFLRDEREEVEELCQE